MALQPCANVTPRERAASASPGGGKTHNLLALGLLAKHPRNRADVMGAFYTPDALGPVRVVAFSGRESDAPLGIWGAIAEQLGKRDQFKDYYTPLAAPGLTAWVNLLQGEPLVTAIKNWLGPRRGCRGFTRALVRE